MDKFLRTYFPVGLSLGLFVAMVWLENYNQGSPGGADTYAHYTIAKWAHLHPSLFFDQWGKPLFTIIAALPAQLGYSYVVALNIALAVGSGFLVFKSANRLGSANAWAGIVFTVFIPMFFYVSFSSLTEIIFAFVAIGAVYLFIQKHYAWSVVILSFIPFARTEGFIFFPLIIIALIAVRHVKYAPLLLAGTLTMGLIGYPVMGDVLWPLNTIPYGKLPNDYGHGSIWHFVRNAAHIFSVPIIVLYFLGFMRGLKKLKSEGVNHQTVVFFLVISMSTGYFAAHSVVWALGIGGSIGLLRVIAGIAPLVGLCAVWGWDWVLQSVSRVSIAFAATIILSVFIVRAAITSNTFPIPMGIEETVIKQAALYIKESPYKNSYFIYYNPVFAFFMDIDRFDVLKGRERLPNHNNISEYVSQGTLVIWDAHFAPGPIGISFDSIYAHPEYELVKVFYPETSFEVYNGKTYRVAIFRKIK